MRGFIKTLFGDARNFCVAAICVALAAGILHTPLEAMAGLVLPLALLAAAAYLAKH
jgi:membrane protease YdiL (CAAX protease family)